MKVNKFIIISVIVVLTLIVLLIIYKQREDSENYMDQLKIEDLQENDEDFDILVYIEKNALKLPKLDKNTDFNNMSETERDIYNNCVKF